MTRLSPSTASPPMAKLLLCSASPRRRELLQQVGIDSWVFPVDIDETPRPHEGAERYVMRMAKEKLLRATELLCSHSAGVQFIANHQITAPLCMLASDTCGVLGTDPTAMDILTKPADVQHFLCMMRAMSGAEHLVMSAIAGVRLDVLKPDLRPLESMLLTRLCTTRVRFRSLGDDELLAYWHTGEPQDKAGGYGIQGMGALLVESIQGSYSNVVGLPLLETHELLSQLGFPSWLSSSVSESR